MRTLPSNSTAETAEPYVDPEFRGTLMELSVTGLLRYIEVREELENDEDALDRATDRELAYALWRHIKRSNIEVRVERESGELWHFDAERGVWTPEGERLLRHAASRLLGKNFANNVVKELEGHVRADPDVEIEADTLGVESGKVAVANGLLDLERAANGEEALRPIKPEDYPLARLPVEYDPTASYVEWADYVEEWVEEGKADALQEYVGLCLNVGDIPIPRALLLVGSGANGKSTFLAVIRALLGEENVSNMEIQTLARERDALAEFHRSVANINDDLSNRAFKSQGLSTFKKLVAGEPVRARRLYQDGFEYTPTGKHLYACNEVPDVAEYIGEDDMAFWRRWLLVEFPRYYPPDDRNPDLGGRLTQPRALSGVLNWAIDGWDRLRRQGRFTGELQYGHDKRKRWLEWGDSIDRFIAECVETDAEATRKSTSEVYQVYRQWCEDEGEQPSDQHALTNKLRKEPVGYKTSLRIDGSSPKRGYTSLRFTDAAPENVDESNQERL